MFVFFCIYISICLCSSSLGEFVSFLDVLQFHSDRDVLQSHSDLNISCGRLSMISLIL